jgi:NitT/TauT family transport system permease protein
MKIRALVLSGVGWALLLGAWEIVGRGGLLGGTFPALSEVLHVFSEDPRRALLMRSAAATLSSAAAGYAAGVSFGTGIATIAHLVTFLRAGLDRTAGLVNALPVIALAPVLIITAGRENTPCAQAAVPVFFLLYTATGVGLRSAGARMEMLLTTFGATRWQRLTKLQAIAAVPAILSGMKIAAGSAMIGAIVGEWFGAPSGLGVVALNSMQNFQIPLLWATVLVIGAITLASYGSLSLLERSVRARIGECGG